MKRKTETLLRKNKVVKGIHVPQINLGLHNSKDLSLALESGCKSTTILALLGTQSNACFFVVISVSSSFSSASFGWIEGDFPYNPALLHGL